MRTIDPRFQSNPDMIKDTRLLIVDHNVCRYHSFDLLMWYIYRLSRSGSFDMLSTLKESMYPLIDPEATVEDRVVFHKLHARTIDPMDCFNGAKPLSTTDYESMLETMMGSGDAWNTRTDISVRLDPLFTRKDVTGYLLRYPADRNRPIYVDNLTVIEDRHVLNGTVCGDVIATNRINAVMVGSADQAIAISARLVELGYREHITFMIAHYGYNYDLNDKGMPYYPKYNEEFGRLEITFHHEYAYFDPFTGISNDRYGEITNVNSAKSGDREAVPDIAHMPGLQ